MKHLYFLIAAFILILHGTASMQANQLPENLPSPERTPIIIRMKDQLDTKSFVQRRLASYSGPVKRSKLIGSMKNFNVQSQESLLTLLKNGENNQEVSNVKQFWITNIIACEATDATIEKIRARNDVESVSIDHPQKLISNESLPQAQADESMNVAYNIEMVRALEANAYGYTGKGIIVGLLDTGVNPNHEDLKEALWTTPEYPNHGWNFVLNNDNTEDVQGHGTHCAGTILGNGKSGVRTGVAPEAKLMVLGVLNSSGTGTQTGIIKAIEFAAEQGANVLSISLGFLNINNDQKRMWRDAMTNLLEFDILAVVAGGNEGQQLSSFKIPNNIRFPGGCPSAWIHPEQTLKGGTSSVLTVGAVTQKGDERLGLSSMGPVTWKDVDTYDDYHYNPGMGLIKPDIMAAGDQVMSTNYKNVNGYTTMSGTSMATPCVAGIVAAILSKNPKLTPAEIVQIISESSIKLSPNFNNQTGAGRADALLSTLYAPNPGMNCKSIIIEETAGYKNGYLNIDDEAILSLKFDNPVNEEIADYQIELKSLSTQASVTTNEIQLPVIKANGETQIARVGHIKVLPGAKVGDLIDIAIIIKKGDKVWSNLFRLPISKAALSAEALQMKEVIGNGNEKAEAGETVDLILSIKNIGTEPSRKVNVSVEANLPYLTFSNISQLSFEEISGTENIQMQCSISSEAPQWYAPSLNLKIKGENIDTTLTYRMPGGTQNILIIDKSKNKVSSRAVVNYLKGKDYSFSEASQINQDADVLKTNYSIWLFAGVYPNANLLTTLESQALSSYLENGGFLYMEGGDLWVDNKTTGVNKFFNIEPLNHNGGKLTTIVGCKSGFNEAYEKEYRIANMFIDQIAPIEPAFALYKNKETEFITTVAYDAGTYRTIGSSFELGGILSEKETSPILDSYLDFFLMVKDGYFTSGIAQTKQTDTLNIACFKSGDNCYVNISTPNAVSAVISLYNSNGQLIHQTENNVVGNAIVRIPVENQKGIHFIKVNADGHSIAKKVLF